MVKWVSNLPNQDAIPYPFIMAEPHVKQLFASLRPSDYGVVAGMGTLFPLALYSWGGCGVGPCGPGRGYSRRGATPPSYRMS
jgi:hypothetical protein